MQSNKEARDPRPRVSKRGTAIQKDVWLDGLVGRYGAYPIFEKVSCRDRKASLKYNPKNQAHFFRPRTQRQIVAMRLKKSLAKGHSDSLTPLRLLVDSVTLEHIAEKNVKLLWMQKSRIKPSRRLAFVNALYPGVEYEGISREGEMDIHHMDETWTDAEGEARLQPVLFGGKSPEYVLRRVRKKGEFLSYRRAALIAWELDVWGRRREKSHTDAQLSSAGAGRFGVNRSSNVAQKAAEIDIVSFKSTDAKAFALCALVFLIYVVAPKGVWTTR